MKRLFIVETNFSYTKLPDERALSSKSSTSATVAIAAELGLSEGKNEMSDIPYYLKETYYRAYVSPRNVGLLDHEIVFSTILWGQHLRLQRAAFAENKPGQKGLQRNEHIRVEMCWCEQERV